jgi:hypothetical protein
MSTRTLAAFSTIRTEGAMLPSDILARVASGDKSLGGLEESSYHLAPGEKIGEATNRAWNRLQAAWANFQSAREKLAGTDTGTSLTRERWLLPLFQLLDYGRLQAAKAEEIGGKSYAISHAWQQTPIHLVGCNVDLDRRIQTAAGGMRSSPHSLVQELLNRSDQHLWGIVSNGLQLRLLRDNISLTRQAYVEFDLEAMMVGEAYPDFVLLWLLLHQSRFEAERPEQCQLEKWSQAARTEGVRVLDGLRDGVQRAIEHLGQGFLAHPSNAVLKENLRSGALDKQDYYRQILRLVYRLLFLFVADDRNLLLVPTADPVTQKRYREFYATTRLRHLATTRAGSRHHDLYCGLKLVMDKLSGDGCPELALPALGSFLFSPRALPALNGCDISNLHLLEAIRSLAVTQTGQSRRVVDYKNLGAEELGSVYESLLELHPDLNAEVASFELKVAAGSERKKTGSYYTPTSLISCLLDSALDPVLLEAAKQPEPEAAILKLRVVDPACGSGHFLIAAAHRIAKRLAAVRTGEEEPPPEAQRKAIRDVIGHCIYGVDVNPMAVELCKVSLWMEALEPGKPLSFLEHRVQSGNSLLGAAPALLAQGIPDEAFTPIEGDDKEICREFKRINKDERNKQMRLFTATTEPWLQLGNFAASLMNLDTVGDDSIEGIRKKERMYEEAIRSGDYLDGRFWADAWCAAFVWKKTREFSYPVTEEVFRRIERNPHACEPWMRSEIERLSGQYRFFHWHLAFPDIFHLPGAGEGARNVHTGWNGGFDVVLGNPPWERIKLQEKEWFSTKSEEVMNAPNSAARKRAIAKIKTEDPALYGEFRAAAREAEAESHLVRNGGRFKLCAQGDLNTYSLFAELFTQVLGTSGFGGIIVPTGIATDDSNSDFFGHLIEQKQLVSLFDFENRERVLFPEVYYRMRFCLLTFCGTTRSCQKPKFTFFALKVEDLSRAGQVFSLSKDDINLINPNSKTCPIFRSQRDAEITKAIYCKVPILLREALGTEGNPWGMVFARSFHMTNDAELFVSEDFFDPTWNQEGNVFTRANEEYLPLYEGRMIDNYDHRLASTRLKDIKLQRSGESITLTSADKTDPTRVARPRYWVSAANIESTSRRMFQQGWLLGCMSITSATNARTCVMSVVPQAGLGNSVIGLLPTTDARHQCCLLADACSLPFDYVCKQKVSGNNFNMFIIKQLPVPLPATFDEVAPWDRSAPLLEWIVPRVMEMAYTSNDLRKFARDAGFDGEPFRWDDDRRFLLRCELDASFLHLFGIDRESASHMIDAFTIVQSREEEEHGEYRTKRVILETYDAMAEAERTSVPYQTRLAPPPADPRVAHPPQSENVH